MTLSLAALVLLRMEATSTSQALEVAVQPIQGHTEAFDITFTSASDLPIEAISWSVCSEPSFFGVIFDSLKDPRLYKPMVQGNQVSGGVHGPGVTKACAAQPAVTVLFTNGSFSGPARGLEAIESCRLGRLDEMRDTIPEMEQEINAGKSYEDLDAGLNRRFQKIHSMPKRQQSDLMVIQGRTEVVFWLQEKLRSFKKDNPDSSIMRSLEIPKKVLSDLEAWRRSPQPVEVQKDGL